MIMKITSEKIRNIKSYFVDVAFLVADILPFAKLVYPNGTQRYVSSSYFTTFSSTVLFAMFAIMILTDCFYNKNFGKLSFVKKPIFNVFASSLALYAFYEMTYPLNEIIYGDVIVEKNIFYYLSYILLSIIVILNIIEWICEKKDNKF